MRIIHFSDFHLSKEPVHINKSQRLMEKFQDQLVRINQEKKIDLIIFSGDMINQGGKSFGNIEQGFKTFKLLLLDKLMSALNLPSERFVFVPGNHDINRDLDNEFVEKGLASSLVTIDSIEKFYSSSSAITAMNRIVPFKTFEREYYTNALHDNYRPSNFQSNIKLNIDGQKVGITMLNTAWRCWDSVTDKGKILLCQNQITDSLAFLEDCDVKIAVAHHSYNWLSDVEAVSVEKLLTMEYDMYLCGHTHSGSAEYCIKPEGRTFKLVSPGILSANVFEKQKDYQNGFSVIDFDLNAGLMETSIYKQDDLMSFQKDLNHGDGGVWSVSIPQGIEAKHNKVIQDVIINIKENVEILNEHLLSYKTQTCAPKSLNQIFVTPELEMRKPLAQQSESGEEFENESISISQLVNSDKNYVIFGMKEAGKTILLDKILLDILNCGGATKVLPVLIEFSEIKRSLEDCIRDYWHQKKADTTSLLKNDHLVLLVDNIDFSDDNRMQMLSSFVNTHPHTRLIGTTLTNRGCDLNLDVYNQPLLDFIKVEIKQFQSSQIRQLVSKWISNNTSPANLQKRVETLINAFSGLNLPRTPFAVSMFLWILERQETCHAQNNAILIKSFLEELLKSLDPKGAPREAFDYVNRTTILSEIAYVMLQKENINYSLPQSDVLRIIEDKLEEFHLSKSYSAKRIYNDFVNISIFTEEPGNIVRFRFSCFFEYFLYVRMRDNMEFFEYVMQEDNYMKFYNEIIYYTGIHRNDDRIIKSVMSRLEYDYIDINNIVFEELKAVDDFFNVGKSIVQSIEADDLMKVLPDKETVQENDRTNDARLRRTEESHPEAIQKKNSNKFNNFGKLLTMSMEVLKNAEELPEKDKKEEEKKPYYYKLVLRNSISYAILFKLIASGMINHADKYPESRIEDLKFMIRLLPVLHEELLHEHLGSYKLAEIMKGKIVEDKSDKTVSEFEKFLSVFLYVDVRGKDYSEVLDEFVGSFNRAYIADACYFKMLAYYYSSTDKAFDAKLVNAMSEMIIKMNSSKSGYKRLNKSRVMQSLTERKQQHENTNRKDGK